MAGDHRSTTNNNIHVLLNNLGLKQYKNTTVFTKNDIFVLSPSVQNKSNWFDIRKVNLDLFTSKYKKGYLIVRFKDLFLIADLIEFVDRMIDQSKYSDTANSGVHWQFVIFETVTGTNYGVKSRLSKYQMPLELVDEIALSNILLRK